MEKILLLAVFLICINSAYANLIINEVMYNPSDDENYNEWIEIYNNGNEEIDLSLWKLCNKNILSGFVDSSDL
ncbi:MAG: lamin tail domain-containing protein, partial [Candidatus Woesearchaeota archaeon]